MVRNLHFIIETAVPQSSITFHLNLSVILLLTPKPLLSPSRRQVEALFFQTNGPKMSSSTGETEMLVRSLRPSRL